MNVGATVLQLTFAQIKVLKAIALSLWPSIRAISFRRIMIKK
jgi:hypothetical protein